MDPFNEALKVELVADPDEAALQLAAADRVAQLAGIALRSSILNLLNNNLHESTVTLETVVRALKTLRDNLPVPPGVALAIPRDQNRIDLGLNGENPEALESVLLGVTYARRQLVLNKELLAMADSLSTDFLSMVQMPLYPYSTAGLASMTGESSEELSELHTELERAKSIRNQLHWQNNSRTRR